MGVNMVKDKKTRKGTLRLDRTGLEQKKIEQNRGEKLGMADRAENWGE